MKFIFVVITVCIFVLSPSYAVEKYHINPVDANNHEDHAFSKTDFEYGLLQRFLGRKTAIVQSWVDCKKQFNSPTEEKDIFKNPETNSVRDMTDTGKCLMDCTMRKTGVLNDNGLNEEQYMLQIKQLRYNYTTFDINKESQDDRDWVLDVIADRAVLLENYQNVRQNAWFDYTCHRKSPHRNLCNDLIQSYAQAARKCKNLKDSKGNKCETAFKIMSCIVEENGKNSFNAPFFPLKWITLDHF